MSGYYNLKLKVKSGLLVNRRTVELLNWLIGLSIMQINWKPLLKLYWLKVRDFAERGCQLSNRRIVELFKRLTG